MPFSQAKTARPAAGPRPGGVQHDHAEVVGDDVVQFPGDPGPLGRRGLLGLALEGRSRAVGQREGRKSG
jgi:hypothetical protein